jgi:hypothetical protein
MTLLMFHVRHNARPTLVREVLEILSDKDDPTLGEVLQIGIQKGYQVGTALRSEQSLKENPIQVARELGLIKYDRLALTVLGTDLVRLLHCKANVFGEILHAFFYSRWTPSREKDDCFSWSYRTTCDVLWNMGSCAIERGSLVSKVSDLAMERFRTDRVSFSKDSVRGVLQWLGELQFPVLSDARTVFARRQFCPPETFILALDYVYRCGGVDYQSNLLLDAEKQEAVCKFCLLEPTAFETSLDWTVGQYSFLHRGSTGGWGNYVVLARQPQVVDFLI